MGPLFLTMANSTNYTTETELSSVNSILGAIGQSPINKIFNLNADKELVYVNPEVSFIHNILLETCKDVQNEGWVFNREDDYPISPDSEGFVLIPKNVLRMDITAGQIWRMTDVVRREGKLYDKVHHTYVFDRPIRCNITWQFAYDDLPSVFQKYITYRASVTAATQLTASSELTQLLSKKENEARASCVEYECNQGNYTYFGWPAGTSYRSYQPYNVLQR